MAERASTEEIIKLRDAYVYDRKHLDYAPKHVQERWDMITSILQEIVEYREGKHT